MRFFLNPTSPHITLTSTVERASATILILNQREYVPQIPRIILGKRPFTHPLPRFFSGPSDTTMTRHTTVSFELCMVSADNHSKILIGWGDLRIYANFRERWQWTVIALESLAQQYLSLASGKHVTMAQTVAYVQAQLAMTASWKYVGPLLSRARVWRPARNIDCGMDPFRPCTWKLYDVE